jgi:hypothetical protein
MEEYMWWKNIHFFSVTFRQFYIASNPMFFFEKPVPKSKHELKPSPPPRPPMGPLPPHRTPRPPSDLNSPRALATVSSGMIRRRLELHEIIVGSIFNFHITCGLSILKFYLPIIVKENFWSDHESFSCDTVWLPRERASRTPSSDRFCICWPWVHIMSF